MAISYPFGNDPAKIARYQRFWTRAAAERPDRVAGLLMFAPWLEEGAPSMVMNATMALLFNGPWRVRAWDTFFASLFPGPKPADLADYRAALRANLSQPGRFDAVKRFLNASKAECARRMEQVGNFNKLQRAREQAFYADATLKLARAQQVQRATRERLTRFLGVWGPQTAFALPERLPDLPKAPLELPDIEQVFAALRSGDAAGLDGNTSLRMLAEQAAGFQAARNGRAEIDETLARAAGLVDADCRRALRDEQHEQRREDQPAGAAAPRPDEQAEAEQALSNNQSPIHPLRPCQAVRDFIDRDCVLCVDGQETLNYARQAIPQFTARHRINSGAYGTMGVGMPFGIGAKAALPDKQVVVLHGDGSWGMNSMEFDTACRHKLPILVIISQNGGWTGDPDRNKPGRDLGYPRYEKFAECFGGHGEYVEKPEDIRPALERAMKQVKAGKPALVCVVTDWKARATTTAFTRYST